MAEKQVIFVKIPAPNEKYRSEMIERINGIAQYCVQSEPGTTKYAACIPREDDGRTLWVFEEYANEAAKQAHLNAPCVKEVAAWVQTIPFAQDTNAPSIDALPELGYISDDSEFSRPKMANSSDPYIVYEESEYAAEDGGAASAKSSLKAILDAAREKEPGTLSFGILEDAKNPGNLATLGIYESAENFRDVHALSGAVQAKVTNTEHLQKSFHRHVLKMVVGYLHR